MKKTMYIRKRDFAGELDILFSISICLSDLLERGLSPNT